MWLIAFVAHACHFKVDPLSLQFKTSNVSVEEKWDLNLGQCVVRVYLEVLKDILSFASGISLPPLRWVHVNVVTGTRRCSMLHVQVCMC